MSSSILIQSHEGMRPIVSGSDTLHEIEINGRNNRRFGNYGSQLRHGIMGEGRNWSKYFNVGRVRCYANEGFLLDESNRKILSMSVAYNNRVIYLLDENFDSPKCSYNHRALRRHWRKCMYMLISRGCAIYKVSPKFLSNFIVRFEYSPSKKVWDQLENELIQEVLEDSKSGVPADRRRWL